MPTALIVEDEPDANELLRLLIATRGYRSVPVFRGSEALTAVRASEPDVVFLDLMLPDLDGFEICRAIKADPATTLIPVVIVTARLTIDCEAEAYRVGANGFVRKPYTPPVLFAVLEAAAIWRAEASGRPRTGRIEVRASDSLGSLRRIGEFQSLLRAWTTLDQADASAVTDAMREIRTTALAAPVGDRGERAATIEHSFATEELLLVVEDHQGWIDSFVRDGAYERLACRGLFDEVAFRPSERSLAMTKRWRVGA